MTGKQQAQRRFLAKRAIDKKEQETCCDCPGGQGCPIVKDSNGKYDGCKGFVRGCTCDNDWEGFRAARQATKRIEE